MYPPEPWNLRGQMYLSIFLVPRAELPEFPAVLGAQVRPIPIGGRAAVGVAWVRYEPGGVLHYRELLSAVLVRRGGRPLVSITDIWVDNVASRDGGRRLWGIPKELAELRIDTDAAGAVSAGAVSVAAQPIAAASVRPGRMLPGRWPLAFSVAQALGERVRVTPVRGRAGLAVSSTSWQPDPAGPLHYLAGRRPVVNLAVTDFWMLFGRPAPARAARPAVVDR